MTTVLYRTAQPRNSASGWLYLPTVTVLQRYRAGRAVDELLITLDAPTVELAYERATDLLVDLDTAGCWEVAGHRVDVEPVRPFRRPMFTIAAAPATSALRTLVDGGYSVTWDADAHSADGVLAPVGTTRMLRQRWTRNDRGVTLVELMVVMIVMGLFAGIVISTIMGATRTITAQTRNAELWADMQDASTQLDRDVHDASSLTLADANTLTVQVVRDDKCQIREWVADTTTWRLVVTTTFFDQVECSGGSTVREDRIIGNNAVGTNAAGSNPTRYLSPVTFAYFDNLSDIPLATPSEPDRVSRISWTLVAEADVGYRDETLTAGAATRP